MTKIAVLGLGAMGSRMVQRLMNAGHTVTVWNRSVAAAEPLVALGARLADSPRDAARDVDIVLAMLSDDVASRQVWTDPESGALSGLQKNALAVECSTLSPAWIAEWGELVSQAGGRPLEAPVSGSRPQAEAGVLVFFLGGDAAVVEDGKDVLSVLGAHQHHVGQIGSGAKVKLITNTLLALQVGAWSELIPTMKKQGLDADAVIAALSTTVLWAPIANVLTKLIHSGEHTKMFTVDLIAKDMGYMSALGAPENLPLVNTMKGLFEKAQDQGLGQENMTTLTKVYDA